MSTHNARRVALRAASPPTKDRELEVLQARALSLADASLVAIDQRTKDDLTRASLHAWQTYREARIHKHARRILP